MGAFVLLVFLLGVGIGVCSWDIATASSLEKWQTMIGAFVALIAAFIGGGFLTKQIRMAWRIEEEKRRRKVLAARSVLPVALSALADYSMTCGTRLQELFWETYAAEQSRKDSSAKDDGSENENAVSAASDGTKPLFPPVPTELIPLFKEIIEHAPESETVSFRMVISDMQLLSANLRDITSCSIGMSPNLGSFAVYCAGLYARCDVLFPYARFESEDTSRTPSREDVSEALVFFGFHKEQPQTEAVFRQAAKRFPEGA